MKPEVFLTPPCSGYTVPITWHIDTLSSTWPSKFPRRSQLFAKLSTVCFPTSVLLCALRTFTECTLQKFYASVVSGLASFPHVEGEPACCLMLRTRSESGRVGIPHVDMFAMFVHAILVI